MCGKMCLRVYLFKESVLLAAVDKYLVYYLHRKEKENVPRSFLLIFPRPTLNACFRFFYTILIITLIIFLLIINMYIIATDRITKRTKQGFKQ